MMTTFGQIKLLHKEDKMKNIIHIATIAIILLTLSGCGDTTTSESVSADKPLQIANSSSSEKSIDQEALSQELLPLAGSLDEEAFIKASLEKIVPTLIEVYVPQELVQEIAAIEVLSIENLSKSPQIRLPLQSFYNEYYNQGLKQRENSFFSLLNSLFENLIATIRSAITNFFSTSSKDSAIGSSSSLHVKSSSSSILSSSSFSSVTLSSSSSSLSLSSSSSSQENENNETEPTLNTAPVIEMISLSVVYAGEMSTYQVEASDKEEDTLTYNLVNGEEWISIDSMGVIQLSPDENVTGTFRFQVKVSDTSSFTLSSSISVEVKKLLDTEELNKNLISELYAPPPKLTIERIEAPVKTTRQGNTMMVPNAGSDGWDIIQVYLKEGLEYELVVIDMSTDEVSTIRGSDINWNGPSTVVARNGKLFISTLRSGTKSQAINMYDPVTNTLTIDVVKIPNDLGGETHPMVMGPDGMIYIAGRGENATVRVLQLNPDTLELIDYGSMGTSHSPNGVWAYHLGVDERFVYVTSGKIPWYLVRYDKQTGESKVLATVEEAGKNINIWHSIYGCFTFVAGEMFYLVDGEMVAGDWNNPPKSWNVPEDQKLYDIATKQNFSNLPPKPEVRAENASLTPEGDGEIWVKNSGDTQWKSYQYTIQTTAKTVYRVFTLPDGRIFGGAKEYDGYFIYDPNVNQLTRLGKIQLSLYAISELNAKIYLSGYPSASLFEYDPSLPWTQNSNDWEPGKEVVDYKDASLNPKFLGYLRESSGIHKVFRSTTAADGNIYFGGRWYRDGVGGGISWWNPTTQKQDGISDIFSNYMVRYMTTTGNGRYVVASTYGVRDDLLHKPTPTKGRLFVFDTLTKEIIRTIDPVAESITTGRVVGVDGDYIIGITTYDERSKTVIYRVNVVTGEMAYKMTFDIPSRVYIGSNQDNSISLKVGPDGYVWTFIRNQVLVKIEPKTGKIHPIGVIYDGLEGGSGEFTFSGKDLYLNGLRDLRLIKNIIP